MSKKLITTALIPTLIGLYTLNISKVRAQSIKADVYLQGVINKLDLYIRDAEGAQLLESGFTLLLTKQRYCNLTSVDKYYLQQSIIRGTISPRNPLLIEASKKINYLRNWACK